MNATAYALAMHQLGGFGVAKLTALLAHYQGDLEQAWLNRAEWPAKLKLSHAQAEDLREQLRLVEPARLHAELLASGAGLLRWGDADYPPLLARIYDPPFLLYYRGKLPEPQEICLALIGSRRASGYGREVAELLARDLARAGAAVVSGMARGIDSVGHQAALKAGGRTYAVLGSGVDVVYPRENQHLYEQIIDQGAVISEFPLGTAPIAQNFPRRNRIISGLCRGVVVIEAGEKSGTLLTVDYGLEQGRDIFAVPGPVTSSQSKGTNRLLRQGAKMATSAADIMQEYPELDLLPKPSATAAETAKQPTAPAGLSAGEQELLQKMLLPQHFDQLLAAGAWPAGQLAALLTMWEIRGLVRQLPGQYYQTIHKNLP